MPVPSYLPSALANLQAAGLSFSPESPWQLAQAAFPQAQQVRPGATLEQVTAEAQAYLRGLAGTGGAPETPGPSSAVTLQSQQPGAPVSSGAETAEGPSGGPTPASFGGRSGFGFGTGLAGSLMGLLTGVPQIGLMVSGIRGMDALSNALGFPQNPQSSFVDPVDLEGAVAQGLLGVPGPSTQTGGPPGSPGPTGVTTGGPSATGTGGPSAGPAGTSGPSASGDGPSSGSGGQAPYRGGILSGPRRKKRKVPEAHGGEFVMNATATDRFRPWLESMNAAVQPNEGLDRLIDRAHGFFED